MSWKRKGGYDDRKMENVQKRRKAGTDGGVCNNKLSASVDDSRTDGEHKG